ncbi:MAG: CDP-alcohol phosphatidyltransferase family protein [Candidatus Heimdallarchaeota archaeon]
MSRWRNFKLKTRSAYKKIMAPIGRIIGKTRISPNGITMIAGVVAITGGTMYALQGRVTSFDHWWAIGFAVMFVAGLIDVLDGSVARATGKTTKFGTVLDPVMDRFAEFCFLMGLAIGDYSFAPFDAVGWVSFIPVGAWCIFCFAGMMFASYSRARGESVADITVESVGIMERREKLALIFLGNILYIWYPIALIISIVLVGLLSFITAIQRMVYIRKEFIKISNDVEPVETPVEENDNINE